MSDPSGCVPPRQPEIPKESEILTASLAELEKSVADLETKLVPVLHPGALAAEPIKTDGPEERLCPMAEDYKARTETVNYIRRLVISMKNRIEL